MATTRSYRFGPGAMELLELRVWTRHRYWSGVRYLKARLTGYYDIAREIDYERAPINIDTAGQDNGTSSVDQLLRAARDGDEQAASRLADELLNWALEDHESSAQS